jgi:DTW domain-containing protein
MSALVESTRQRKTKNPCVKCGLHIERCLCSELKALLCQTRLSLIIHNRELRRTTNTGMLAHQILQNSESFIRGLENQPLDFKKILLPNFQNLLLYPADDAIELSSFEKSKDNSLLPINLIVPDGNWRQAGKVHYRYSELDGVPRVKFSEKNLNTEHLRRENSEIGMSTLEAIAKAFAILESLEVGNELMRIFLLKRERTLAGRPPQRLQSSAT